MNNTSIPKFEDLMDKIRADQELNEVPEEIMAEMEVRQGLARVVPEVREKIRNGEPF